LLFIFMYIEVNKSMHDSKFIVIFMF